jgi:predicted transcriptional regulator
MNERLSSADVLSALADSKLLDMFHTIAIGNGKSEDLKNRGITKKQFYSRTAKLIKTGLVRRVKGHFILTNFGKVVYHAELAIEASVTNYWKLKAIDSIQSSGQIQEDEKQKLLKSIINDNTLERILVK